MLMGASCWPQRLPFFFAFSEQLGNHPVCRTNTPPVLPSIYLYNLKQTKVFAFVPILTF